MKHILTLIIFLIFNISQTSFAEDGFVILMNNGSSFQVDHYDEENDFIAYYQFGTKIEILKKDIKKITSVSDEMDAITVAPDDSLFVTKPDFSEKSSIERKTLEKIPASKTRKKKIAKSDCEKLQMYKKKLRYYTALLAEEERNVVQRPPTSGLRPGVPGTIQYSKQDADRIKKWVRHSNKIDDLKRSVKRYKQAVDSYQKKCNG